MTGRMTELGRQQIFIINAAKLKLVPNDEIAELLVIYIQWLEDNMMVWGKIESQLTIVDMKDMKLRDLPMRKLYSMLEPGFMQSMGWTHYTLIINSSWFLTKLFELVKSWFDEVTQLCMHMVDQENTFQLLLSYLRVDQIEEKHGGTKPNINKFFPPVY